MRVGYTAFGAMAVTVDGTTHALTRRRERGVLAVLLAARGAPVSAERLLGEVWGDESAGQGLAAVQVAVSRLRSLLEPDRSVRGGTRLVSTTAGYAVRAATDEVDTWTFEAGVEASLAASHPADRLGRAEQALAAWTAEPFADVEATSVRAEADRLGELRLVAHEQRAQALLDLGRPDDAQRGLAAVADDHPYRERLWALLALAQYRAARQADALATLRSLRAVLADELGVDPLPETRALEEAVLRQDADLAGPAPAAPAAPAAPRADADPSGRVRADPATSELVGRRTEVDRLRSLAADPRPRTRFALVTGEAGIGKSRVVAELAVLARASGVRVLTGHCVEGGYAPPLWPWSAVVRPLVEGAGADPVLAPLTDDAPPPDAGPGGTVRLHDAVSGLLATSASEQPLLVVLEDLHWADDSSLLLLRHLATTLPAAPLTVVCTRRSADTPTAGPLLDTLATLARAGAERVRLDGLDTAEVGALLTDALGAHEPRVDALVAEVTGGNPFFVEQYARLLATLPDPAEVDPSSLPVPDGVADVLRQRLARLPDEVAGLLGTAAVLGRHVDPDLLADLSGVPVDRCLDALDLALTSGLLEEADAGYAFVHALARETLYAGLSTARRLRLHDRAGRLVEARHDPAHDPAREPGHGPVAEVAAHARLAAPLGAEHAVRAVTWLARAAELAAARTAHPEARDLWREVLAVAPPGSADTVRAHRGTATALLRLGDVEAAQAELGRAITLAGERRDWDAVADAAAVLVSAGPWTWREHGVLHEPLVGVMTEAVEHVEPARRARLLALLQVEHFYRWRSDEVEVQGRRSVEVARAVGDPDLLREVLLLRIIASTGSWDARGRLALVEELMALEPQGELGVTALFHLGQVRWDHGDPLGADDAVRRCAEAAASLRHAGLDIPLAWWRAARARDRDDPAYDALLADAVERHRAAGYFANRELTCLHAVRTGQVGAPVDAATVALAEEGGMPLRALVAHALLESGDAAGAHALLGPRVPDTIVDYCSTAGRCLRLLVLAETGTPDEVRDALAPLEGHLGAPVSYGSIDHLGVVDHFVAAGYAALGDERAVEVARSAVAGNLGLGVLPWWRRSQDLLARLTS